MKLLVLLGLIMLGGSALTLFAIQSQRTEIGTLEIEQQSKEQPVVQEEPEPKPQETAQTPEHIAETAGPEPQSVTKSACLALEQQLQEELERAERDLGRAQDEYDDAEESYDDALSANEPDQQYIELLKKQKEDAKDALEDVEGDYNGAQKRLSRARVECGLFQ